MDGSNFFFSCFSAYLLVLLPGDIKFLISLLHCVLDYPLLIKTFVFKKFYRVILFLFFSFSDCDICFFHGRNEEGEVDHV